MNRRDFIQKLGSVGGLMAGIAFLPKLIFKVPPEPTPTPIPSPTPTIGGMPMPEGSIKVTKTGVHAWVPEGSIMQVHDGMVYKRGDGAWARYEYPETKYKVDKYDHGHGELVDPGHSHSHIPNTMGYGACSISGCACPAFMGSEQLCANCGHNYSYHW
jgi:hypothetical protein